jgi:hypothetical protein
MVYCPQHSKKLKIVDSFLLPEYFVTDLGQEPVQTGRSVCIKLGLDCVLKIAQKTASNRYLHGMIMQDRTQSFIKADLSVKEGIIKTWAPGHSALNARPTHD